MSRRGEGHRCFCFLYLLMCTIWQADDSWINGGMSLNYSFCGENVMAVYKKTQIGGIVVLVLALVAGALVLVRPDLMPVAGLERGVAAIVDLVAGKEGDRKPAEDVDNPPVKKDIYRIDLKTGGRIYTDNLKKSDGTFIYTTGSGMVVAIQGHEVVGLVTFKEGEEPRE